jgi:hypothetical protein
LVDTPIFVVDFYYGPYSQVEIGINAKWAGFLGSYNQDEIDIKGQGFFS